MNETRSQDRLGLALIVSSLVFLGLVAAIVGWRSTSTPQLDPVTLCAVGRPVAGEVAILLDVTDSLTPDQYKRVIEWLREYELSALQRNERVSLWVLGSRNGGGLERRFCRCYPGRERDPWLHNPASIATTTDSLFTAPLRHAVVDAGQPNPSLRTPLLAAIREISEQPEMSDSLTLRHLVVVSDLQENVEGLSFYKGVPTFGDYSRSKHSERTRAALRGMTIDVLYLPRGDTATLLSPDLPLFWRQYFRACGASSARIRRL
ncbi:MAG: hypothetical protein ABI960_00745 [Candidatus Eisenbacteria bacterium]